MPTYRTTHPKLGSILFSFEIDAKNNFTFLGEVLKRGMDTKTVFQGNISEAETTAQIDEALKAFVLKYQSNHPTLKYCWIRQEQ